MSATKHIQTEGNAGGAPYYVPPEPKRWPSIGLAVGVHVLLLAFLVIGLNWQNTEPVAVEAEVWDTTTQTAAPPPPPAPEPEPQPETPPPEPVQKAVEPPPPVEQPVVKQPDPEIALEREKKRKEKLKRQEEERVEHEREVAEQKRADEKKAKLLAEKKEREQAEKKVREDAEKKELAKKEEADKKKKLEKEKAEKLAKEKAEKARLDKLHDEDVKRMMAAAGNTGSAEKSSAPRRDNGYIAAITAKVKGNSSYGGSEDAPGNPTVTFHVEQLPTGEIISVRKTKSSGIPAFDDAVEKAINKSSPLPKKKDGTVERSLEINFKMKEMQ